MSEKKRCCFIRKMLQHTSLWLTIALIVIIILLSSDLPRNATTIPFAFTKKDINQSLLERKFVRKIFQRFVVGINVFPLALQWFGLSAWFFVFYTSQQLVYLFDCHSVYFMPNMSYELTFVNFDLLRNRGKPVECSKTKGFMTEIGVLTIIFFCRLLKLYWRKLVTSCAVKVD